MRAHPRLTFQIRFAHTTLDADDWPVAYEALKMDAGDLTLEVREAEDVKGLLPQSLPLSSPPSSLQHQPMSTATQGPALGPGQQNHIRTIDEQHAHIERTHPGLMDRLYQNLVNSADAEQRSLLRGILGTETEQKILSTLIGEPADNYTEKMDSVFLIRFDQDQNTTTTEFRPNNPIYARLAATGADETASGSDSGFESASGFEDLTAEKNPIAQRKALQVMLAYNHFIGRTIKWREPAYTMSLVGGPNEQMSTANLFSGVQSIFHNIFDIFSSLETGITVDAVKTHRLSSGGEIDLGVLVSGSMTSKGRSEPVTEYAAIVEFKRPNAGFGLAWKLLNGQRWTDEERAAFFKLKNLSPNNLDFPDPSGILKKRLESWQKDPAVWTAAEEVLKRTGTNKVEVKYSTESSASLFNTGTNKGTEYFVDGDDGPEDITGPLTASKFKDCLDSSLDAVAQVTTHAAPNGCTRIAIADILTVVTGSLRTVEKSTDLRTNRSNDDDVLDVHLHDTAMLQTHDKDSALYMLEYLCEAAMSNTMVRSIGDKLLTAADNAYQGGELTVDGVKEVAQRMAQRDIFTFNSRDHSSKDLTLVESSKLLSVKTRAHIQQLLADFKECFRKIKSRAADFTSDTFVICKRFREVDFKDFGIYDPWDGRSKSVAKVQKRGKDDEKFYVLKEYFADELSVSRMSDELEAYARISKLPRNAKKYFAQLVSFGSLDLDTANPRLYLLLEYVEDFDADGMCSIREKEEVEYVDKLLRAVGIRHNDIQALNYRWQLQPGGNWYIKVFNIDGVTYFDSSMMKRKMPVSNLTMF